MRSDRILPSPRPPKASAATTFPDHGLTRLPAIDEYVQTEYDVARCSYRLLQSNLFASEKDYVRRQIVYSLLQVRNRDDGLFSLRLTSPLLLQEDSPATLHFITAFLIYDGRENETTFEMMNEEGAFPRLVELIQQKRDGDAGLHRMLLELLYEMSRIQRLRTADLSWSLTSLVVRVAKLTRGP